MVQQISKGDVLQRLGSLCFVVGAILLVVFNVLLPRADDPSDTASVLKAAGDNETLTQLSAFLIAVGLWAVMIGIVGVYRSITSGAAATWARLGFYGTVVSVSVWTVALALHMAMAGAAAEGAAGQATAAALRAAGEATFGMAIVTLWLALTFLGVGMALSAVYPKWLGWVAIALGVLTTIVGAVVVFAGETTTLQLVFMILSLLTTLWALVLGLWIARKAW